MFVFLKGAQTLLSQDEQIREETGEHAVFRNSLGSRYKLVGVVPISEQVSGLLVVNTDVVVLKHAGEEVIYLPCYIQDVLNPE